MKNIFLILILGVLLSQCASTGTRSSVFKDWDQGEDWYNRPLMSDWDVLDLSAQTISGSNLDETKESLRWDLAETLN